MYLLTIGNINFRQCETLEEAFNYYVLNSTANISIHIFRFHDGRFERLSWTENDGLIVTKWHRVPAVESD